MVALLPWHGKGGGLLVVAVGHDIARALEPEIDLRMIVRVQRECIARRHHRDPAHDAVGRGVGR
jgi:hypothetical protein